MTYGCLFEDALDDGDCDLGLFVSPFVFLWMMNGREEDVAFDIEVDGGATLSKISLPSSGEFSPTFTGLFRSCTIGLNIRISLYNLTKNADFIFD